MTILPRKAILAVAAVIDIAVNANGRPVSARALAARHGLPPRHLEPVLQAFVRDGILKGIRGPGGGYELARDARDISAEEILRAAGTVDDADPATDATSRLVSEVVLPALAEGERAFSKVLAQVSVADMARRAESLSSHS